MEMEYKCIKCGMCCRNLDTSDVYKDLHRGDGICIYLDLEKNLCTIYKNRPTLCNIDLSYDEYFLQIYSKEEYYELNYKGCRNLWEKKKIERKKRKIT